MKYFKSSNILSLIIMLLFSYTSTVLAEPNYNYIKGASINKPTVVVSKNKTMNKVKQNIAKTIKIKISGFAFNPNTVAINKGDTIIWTNLDSMAHTVTSKSFDSGNMNMNATFKYTFKTAGTFKYVCTYHPNMTGTVVVK